MIKKKFYLEILKNCGNNLIKTVYLGPGPGSMKNKPAAVIGDERVS